MLAATPKLSYVVLSYNYRRYVDVAIRSVLEQSIQDFEIVVVDDGSIDGSPDLIRSFGDERIRLVVNDQNRGGAWSYNRAVDLARGEYLVNLDADDWVAPDKAERQLAAFAQDPSLDIVGTFIAAVDATGAAHPERATIEGYCNRPIDLNRVESWIVQNPLCRSSTMMRRATHLRIGLDDPTMAYACDWELWTRALREGCRFLVLPDKLTSYRWHGGNVTHRNPRAQLLEIAFLLGRNTIPTIESRAAYLGLGQILNWLVAHEHFARLRPVERYRLLASLISPPQDDDFAAFSHRILAGEGDPAVERLGRLCLASFRYSPASIAELAHYRDIQSYERAKRDWFVPRIKHLEDTIAENERVRAEWYLPRIEHLESELTRLERAIAVHESTKAEWFLPRIHHLETETERLQRASEVYEKTKAEWFVPRIAHLEEETNRLQTVVQGHETARAEALLPQIDRLEREVERLRAVNDDLERAKAETLEPRIRDLERLLAEERRRGLRGLLRRS